MKYPSLEITEDKDPQDMIGYIRDLPDQLERAWNMSMALTLPEMKDVRQVVIVGVGGSAIGADLLCSYVQPLCTIPTLLWRNYGLPRHAGKPGTLVVFSSKSGNTEEVLEAFEDSLSSSVYRLVMTTGGRLADRGREAGAAVWQFDHPGEPRTAVGYSFGLLLGLLQRIAVIPEQDSEIRTAVAAMKAQQGQMEPEVPLEENPARQIAQQMHGAWPVFLGSDFMAPVARRWRSQVAELAKALAQFEEIPEANHNMLEAFHNPIELHPASLMIFLQAAGAHTRNTLRSRFTEEIFREAGLPTAVVHAAGDTRLAQQWTCLHYGDYAAYYLALDYHINPTPVPAMQALKARLKAVS